MSVNKTETLAETLVKDFHQTISINTTTLIHNGQLKSR